jgi:GABA permease
VTHVGPPDELRVLVVANETVGGAELMDAIGERARSGRTRFLVVCPALTSRLRTWTSDEDGARSAAQRRLETTLARLASAGIEAQGAIGDLDPLVAMEDAVRTFHPDEIVVSTHPEGRSNWLERGVVAAARERFDLTVTHVVVDLAQEPPQGTNRA